MYWPVQLHCSNNANIELIWTTNYQTICITCLNMPHCYVLLFLQHSQDINKMRTNNKSTHFWFCTYLSRVFAVYTIGGVCLHFPVNNIFTKCPYLFHPHMTLKFSLSDTQNTPIIVPSIHTIHEFTQNQFGIEFGKTTHLQRKLNFQIIYFRPKTHQNHSPAP